MYRRGNLPRMATLAFENALDLHGDSIHLFKRGSYGSSLALSVLAAEEVGKYCIIEDLVWNSDVNGPWTPAEKQLWLYRAYDHRAKQNKFACIADLAVAARLLRRIEDGQLERDKQRGIYVSLPRRGKAIDIAARVSTPRHIGRRAAEVQITSVNDCLVVLCIGCSTGVYGLDIDDVQEGLTLALARTLSRKWPRMGAEARAFAGTASPKWWKTRRRTSRSGDGGLTRRCS